MSQSMGSDVTSDDKLWAALAYLFSPLVPVVLFLMEDKKNRPYIKAHNAQALVLGILSYALIGVFCIGIIPALYQLYCAYKAYQGEYIEIPLVTNFLKNQGWA